MFRDQGAILRGFIKKKIYKYNMYVGAICTCPFVSIWILIWKHV